LHIKEPKKNGLMESKAYRTYLEEEKAWLADYALYMAVKDSFDGKSWDQWEEDIRLRKPEAIAAYQEQLSAEIDFYVISAVSVRRTVGRTENICQ